MDAKQRLDALNGWLEDNGLDARVEFSAPIAAADIDAAEQELGCRLPPSYRRFVGEHGTFVVSGALTGRGDGNDTCLFPPAALVSVTKHLRAELEASSDEDSAAILVDGIAFCDDPADEFFHLFVVSGAAADGEMKTRGYDYQDPANTDPWFEGDGTFDTVVDGIIATVRAHALD